MLAAESEQSFLDVCTHQYGCRVVQRILEHGDVGATSWVTDFVINHFTTLTKDTYGHFVVEDAMKWCRGVLELNRRGVLELNRRGAVVFLNRVSLAAWWHRGVLELNRGHAFFKKL